MNNKKKEHNNEPLMFIQTVQKINNKIKSQVYYDSRNKTKKEEYPSG